MRAASGELVLTTLDRLTSEDYPESHSSETGILLLGRRRASPRSGLDGSNDWIYRHVGKAVDRMSELAERFPDESA